MIHQHLVNVNVSASQPGNPPFSRLLVGRVYRTRPSHIKYGGRANVNVPQQRRANAVTALVVAMVTALVTCWTARSSVGWTLTLRC